MKRMMLGRVARVLGSERLFGALDAALLCLGCGFTVGSALPPCGDSSKACKDNQERDDGLKSLSRRTEEGFRGQNGHKNSQNRQDH